MHDGPRDPSSSDVQNCYFFLKYTIPVFIAASTRNGLTSKVLPDGSSVRIQTQVLIHQSHRASNKLI